VSFFSRLFGRREDELNDELADHFRRAVEHRVARGESAESARAAVRREFGNVGRVRELTRGSWGVGERLRLGAERAMRDLRFGVRRLARRPGFTAIAVLSIAVGIGANTTIFSVIEAVLLRRLPLAAPADLVDIYKQGTENGFGTLSFPDLRDLEQESGQVFSAVGGYRLAFVQEDAGDGVETLFAEVVTGNYFSMLGVSALQGRTLLPSDDVGKGGHPVVMVSYGYWQRRFGGDPAAVGRQVRLNGRQFTIVGVLPEAYTGSARGLMPAIYAPRAMVGELQPMDFDELESRGNQTVFVKARLLPGVSVAAARGFLDQMTDFFVRASPKEWSEARARLVPTADVIVHPMVDRVLVSAAVLLMAVVALVLVIACANLASFLLAQATDRRKEVAVRVAIGAGRGALVRQLLTESVALSGLGALVGLLLTRLALGAIERADLPLPLPIALDLRVDAAVLWLGLGLAVAAGVAFGLAPALQATKTDVARTLKNETVGGRPRRLSFRAGLVVAQVALSLVLLVGAVLFLRSLRSRLAIDPGFGYSPAAILSFQPASSARSPERARRFFSQLREQVAARPDIEHVGLTSDLPLSPLTQSASLVDVPGVEPPPGSEGFRIDRSTVDEGYFEAAGIPILEGRSFGAMDDEDGARTTIVSETFARRFWSGSALGRTFRVNGVDYTVVGVTRDTKISTLGEDPRPQMYFPFLQNLDGYMTLVATTTGDAERIVPELMALARGIDPDVVVIEAKTMDRHLAAMLLPHRLAAWLIAAFGAVALLLSSIGLFGIVSYAVAARSREMAIRMALGSAPRTIVRLQMGSALSLVLVGGGVGLALSLLAARALSGALYGVDAMDPVAFVVAPAVLLGVAVLAAWLPTRRVRRMSVVKVLRSE